MKRIIRRIFGHFDYAMHYRSMKVYALLAIGAHLFFYFILKDLLNFEESLSLRLGLIFLFVVAFFMPPSAWRTHHKIFYEVVLFLNMPVFFSWMMVKNDLHPFWLSSYIFATMIYSIFSLNIINILIQVGIIFIGLPLFVLYYKPSLAELETLGLILALSWMTVAIVLTFKTRLLETIEERKEMTREVVARNDFVSNLLYISSELTMYDQMTDVFNIFIERIEAIMTLNGIGLFLIAGDGPYRVVYDAVGKLSSVERSFLIDNINHVIETGRVQIYRQVDGKATSRWYVFDKSFPVIDKNGTTIHHMLLTLHCEPLPDIHVGVFQIFLEQLSGNVRTRYLTRELERYAKLDHMTGMLNRSAYIERFERLKRAYDERYPFTIIFGDINGLKYINDTYGHTDGDTLIRRSGEILKDALGMNTPVYRFGGDEMVVILENKTYQEALEPLHEIEKAFSKQTIICRNEVTGEVVKEPLSVAFGMVDSTEGRLDDLLDLADVKMRDSKDSYYRSTKRDKYR